MTAITHHQSLPTGSFAGWPLASWAHAFRIWIAMMAALYVAFWLQLDGASSAAVTVGILALPTRGQVIQKSFYRLVATGIGLVASIVISGLFAQSRDLFILAFAMWIALCVFAAGLLDGNRAYGAVLSGLTVAIVAVQQIDTPVARPAASWRKPVDPAPVGWGRHTSGGTMAAKAAM